MMTASKLRELREKAQQESPFTRVALNEISDPAYIRKQLEVELSKHLRAKESMDRLVERIERVADVNKTRAKRIAQTEKTRATNGGRLSSILKKYLDDYDKAVRQHGKRPPRPDVQWVEPMVAKHPRHDHIGISGKIVPVGDEFLPNLRYPGDLEAPIGQTANCHCYIRKGRG